MPNDTTAAAPVPGKFAAQPAQQPTALAACLGVQMSTTRWKLLCAALAALSIYSWTRGREDHVRPAAASRPRAAGYRPLRVPPAALGTSTAEIVEGLLASRSHAEMRRLAEQLGAVGDDAAIDAVLGLVRDPRPGVPELIIGAIGAIGTDHAVEVLIDLADDPRAEIQSAAVVALGATGSERAESFLVKLARRQDGTAITALGQLATDRAVEVLYRIATSGADEPARLAIAAIGSVDSPAAAGALARLIDSPSLDIAAKAIESIQNVDGAMLAKLTALVNGGESQLVGPALLAIAHAGDAAIPLLRDLAQDGATGDVRRTAVQALGTIHASAVVETLSALVDGLDDELAREAARALAQLDTPDAREVLVSAALSDRAEATDAIAALVGMEGPDIDHVLLEIAKADLHSSDQALARLLAREHDEALALVVARAGSADPDVRFDALEVLADAGTDAASSKLLALVRAEHGEHKARALELVTKARPGDPQVTELLRDSLHALDGDEKRAAAQALGRVGSDEARDALLGALASGDDEVTMAALAALGSYRLDEAASTAIHAAAVADPALRPEAMRKLLAAGSPAGLRLAEASLDAGSGEAVRTIQFLAESGVPGAAELIARSTRAPDEYVRANALRSLGAMRAGNAVELATHALRDDSSRVRETAAATLGSLGGDRARDALLALSRSSNPLDRMQAVQHLPDDTTALRRTRELLGDPDASVAYYAMRSLAASREGAASLRAYVLAPGASFESRLDAANLLDSYDQLDAATLAWLEQARGDIE